MKFSEKLMNLRKSKGMSQEELASKLNVTRQSVSKWKLDQTTPDMNKLIEIAKLFEISLDELINDIETSNTENTYKESAVEKNNKKISISILIIGIILSIILCGVGWIRQNNATKTNEKSYNDAYALSEKNYNEAMERVNNIDTELEELNPQKDTLETEKNSLTMGSANWFSETQRLSNEIYDLNVKIMNLQSEKNQLQNANYTVYYNPVKSINYLIYYYIGAGIFTVAILIALIYFLVTRRKK